MADIEKTINKLFQNQENVIVKLFKVQDVKINNIETKLNNLENEVHSISKTVAKIEVEHGEKIDALFDAFKMHDQKIDRIIDKLNKHDKTIDKHSDEIYYLKAKKEAI